MHPDDHQYAPRLIAWELTRQCTLRCKHCRAAAQQTAYAGELSLDEIRRVTDSIAPRYKPIVILTGGEPMLRTDLLDIVGYLEQQRLRPVLATCGSLLNVENARALKQAGLERVSVSIDGADARRHDAFRGVPGAFDSLMAGLDALRQADMPFQVNTTVTRSNVDQLDSILRLAVDLGAVAFHPFLLVPIGRGEQLVHDTLDAAEYERVLHHIYELRDRAAIPFKPTCAPHYYRILRQREAAAGRRVHPESHGLDAMSKGCMGGRSFAFISHRGIVQMCGFLDVEAGDLRQVGFDFHAIWRNSPLFAALRDYKNYRGKCGPCEYRQWCGGCRARAFAMTGDYLAEEPFCEFIPRGGRLVDAAPAAEPPPRRRPDASTSGHTSHSGGTK